MKVLVYRKCSTCMKALKWLEENMLPHYPLGVYKDGAAGEDEQA